MMNGLINVFILFGRRNKQDLGLSPNPVEEDILDGAGFGVSGSHQVLTDY